jgi:hypothetical protein
VQLSTSSCLGSWIWDIIFDHLPISSWLVSWDPFSHHHYPSFLSQGSLANTGSFKIFPSWRLHPPSISILPSTPLLTQTISPALGGLLRRSAPSFGISRLDLRLQQEMLRKCTALFLSIIRSGLLQWCECRRMGSALIPARLLAWVHHREHMGMWLTQVWICCAHRVLGHLPSG